MRWNFYADRRPILAVGGCCFRSPYSASPRVNLRFTLQRQVFEAAPNERLSSRKNNQHSMTSPKWYSFGTKWYKLVLSGTFWRLRPLFAFCFSQNGTNGTFGTRIFAASILLLVELLSIKMARFPNLDSGFMQAAGSVFLLEGLTILFRKTGIIRPS
jgi:hypothetical protein